MNVLNVAEIERELRIYAARALSDHTRRWVMTVARNYILGKLPSKDVLENFREVCLCHYTETLHAPKQKHDPEKYDPPELPLWAARAVERGETLVWFDPIQCRRREIWRTIPTIMLWFNEWKLDDPRLPRIDRISFEVAANAAMFWHKDVVENIWDHVSDKTVTVKVYDHGFRWVKLISALQFEREGNLMNHCVGNGNYFAHFRDSSTEYYSLRDRHNKPHTTMEVSNGSVRQCKGKGNGRPDNSYQPYIQRFIADMKWTVGGDKHHIDFVDLETLAFADLI